MKVYLVKRVYESSPAHDVGFADSVHMAELMIRQDTRVLEDLYGCDGVLDYGTEDDPCDPPRFIIDGLTFQYGVQEIFVRELKDEF